MSQICPKIRIVSQFKTHNIYIYIYVWGISSQYWRHAEDMSRVISFGSPQKTCLTTTREAKRAEIICFTEEIPRPMNVGGFIAGCLRGVHPQPKDVHTCL